MSGSVFNAHASPLVSLHIPWYQFPNAILISKFRSNFSCWLSLKVHNTFGTTASSVIKFRCHRGAPATFLVLLFTILFGEPYPCTERLYGVWVKTHKFEFCIWYLLLLWLQGNPLLSLCLTSLFYKTEGSKWLYHKKLLQELMKTQILNAVIIL